MPTFRHWVRRGVALLRRCDRLSQHFSLRSELAFPARDCGGRQAISDQVDCGTSHVHQLVNTRSEEHTSELQSHLNLVCRLLLEKKKATNATDHHTNAGEICV